MARIEKIARLPQELWEELNRRLAYGQVGALLRWVNVERMLKEMAARGQEQADSQGESKLVQPKKISGALGRGNRITAEAVEYSRSAGLPSIICTTDALEARKTG